MHGNTKHGATVKGKYEKIYKVWISMKSRCNYPKNPSYKWYGAKGIKICERWNSFESFRSDMGEMPSESHQIDRIDSTENYYPENCRWSTPKENSSNTSHNRWIEFDGERKTLTQWAEFLGIRVSTLKNRIDYCKWSLETSLNSTLRTQKGINKRNDPLYLKTYSTWSGIHKRIKKPVGKNISYKNVKICERWNSFENFIKDMGIVKSQKASFRRIDTKDHYFAENCRWEYK